MTATTGYSPINHPDFPSGMYSYSLPHAVWHASRGIVATYPTHAAACEAVPRCGNGDWGYGYFVRPATSAAARMGLPFVE